MPRPDSLQTIGYVYIVCSDSQDAVKFGFASDPYTRVKSLQTGNPARLDILGVFRATYEAELELHRLLKPYQLRLEWYDHDDMTFILIDELMGEWQAKCVTRAAEDGDAEDFDEAFSYAAEAVHMTKDEVAAIASYVIGKYSDLSVKHDQPVCAASGEAMER